MANGQQRYRKPVDVDTYKMMSEDEKENYRRNVEVRGGAGQVTLASGGGGRRPHDQELERTGRGIERIRGTNWDSDPDKYVLWQKRADSPGSYSRTEIPNDAKLHSDIRAGTGNWEAIVADYQRETAKADSLERAEMERWSKASRGDTSRHPDFGGLLEEHEKRKARGWN